MTVLGLTNARYTIGDDPSAFLASLDAALARERATLAMRGPAAELPPADYLAISGGGDDGAFGAGLLLGWTANGTRPKFRGVTGISTGALTAPFAFLGTDYDPQLREVYTAVNAEDLLARRSHLGALVQDAAADNAPLRAMIARFLDDRMLQAIAQEHREGRILLIGTTDLDTQRPVIWNIGVIAASGRAGALELVRNILLASAAIPGVFPPVMMDVELDGRAYQEMHVDGGTSAQVFLYPPSINLAARGHANARKHRLYVIRNAPLEGGWAEVPRRTLAIAARALLLTIQNQGIGDIYRIYLAAQRDNIDFNLAYIPSSFRTVRPAFFDQGYMQELFAVGYELGRQGYPWATVPPGFTQPTVEPPPGF